MEAIVLAGGRGTRLSGMVPDRPKPMAPVAGRPFLEILLGWLDRQGVRHAVISLGYRAEDISSHFGERFRRLQLSYEVERTPLGTGGAVRAALQHCGGDHALVLNGDTYVDVELSDLEACWTARRRPIVVGCEVDDTGRFGRLEIDGDSVVRFLEKTGGGPGVVNAGCYVLPTDCLAGYDPGRPFSLEAEFLVPAAARGELSAFVTGGLFIDIGVPEDYQRAQALLAEYAR